MKKPLISFIIPCYNVEGFIERAIDCALAQSYNNIEIVCVNDGSTDNTSKILHSLEKSDSKIVVIEQENRGILEARRTAINHSKGEYIALLDADDLLEKYAIEHAYDSIIKTRSQGAVFEYHRYGSEDTSAIVGYDKDGEVIDGKNAFINNINRWTLSGFGVFKKELYVKAYNEFDETCINTRIYSDEVITKIVFLLSNQLVKIKSKYFYYYNADSATKKFRIDWLDSLKAVISLKRFSEKKEVYHLIKKPLVIDAVQGGWHMLLIWKKYSAQISDDERGLCNKLCRETIREFRWRDYFSTFFSLDNSLRFKIKLCLMVLKFKISI